MRPHLRLSMIALAAGALAVTGTTALASAAPVATPAATPTARPAVRPAATPTAQPVSSTAFRLITGDTVLVRSVGGRTSVDVSPLAGSSRAFTSMRVGSHHYVFPAAARYFAGAVLDPSLFDVTAATSRIPLDVAFTGSRPDVPGLTVTSSTGTSLHGYVTAAGTRAFGAALRTQWHRDVRAGMARPTNLFGATRIARAATTPAAHPDFPQVTLVITATGRSGQPLPSGEVGLINTDDGRKYNNLVSIVNGQGRASVPVGNYSLIADDTTFDRKTFVLHSSIEAIPDFTVTKNLQHVALDFRDATVKPSISTPRPATLEGLTLDWERTVPHGGLGFSYFFGPSDTARVAPAPAPTHGRVDWLTTWQLTGTPANATPYRYDATYHEHTIPADQSRVFTLAKAGQSDTNFYSDGTTRDTAYGRSAVYPFQDFLFTFLLPSTAPRARTDYLLGPADASWVDSYIAAPTYDDPFQGSFQDEPRSYPPGTRQRVDWLRGPLAPGVPEPSDDSNFFFCSTCRTDTSMALFLAPIVDTTPGHAGSIDATGPRSSVASFTLYRDGKKIKSEQNSTGDVVNVPRGRSTYRAVVTTDLAQAGFLRSTHAVTDLRFVSAAGQGGALPDTWFCPIEGPGCRVLPLLTATVPLPTDLTGTMPLGSTSFVFTVDGARGGPALSVPNAQLSISLDGGKTYRSEPVHPLGGGRFRVTITHPASDAGHLVTLRVSGRDTQGGSITETVDDAYLVANS